MYSKNHCTNLQFSSTPSPWYTHSNYHQPPNSQFLSESDSPTQAPMYYHPHHIFPNPESWPGHESISSQQHQNPLMPPGSGVGSGSGGSSSTGGGTSGLHLNNQNVNNEHLNESVLNMPSPPITLSGSEMSSPGAPNGPQSPHHNNAIRTTPPKSPYDWIKKTSYTNQPNPGKKMIHLFDILLRINR